MEHDRWQIIVPGSFSGTMVLVIVFLAVWSGIVAFGTYSEWTGGKQRSDSSFAFVPMIAVGLFFWGLVLRSIFGKLSGVAMCSES